MKKIAMFLRLLYISTFVLLILFSNNIYADSGSQKQKLRIGVIQNNPFSFQNEKGEIIGLDIDIADSMMAEMGYSKNQYTYTIGTRESIISDLKNDNLDYVAGFDIYSETDNALLLGGIITSLNFNITSANDRNLQTLEELKNKTIITRRNSAAHKYLIAEKITDKFIFSDNMDSSLEILKSGQGDAVFGNDVITKQALNNLGIHDFTTAISSAPQMKHVIATTTANSKLLAKLDDALRLVKSKESYLDIYNKWIVETSPKSRIMFYLTVFGASTFVVLLLLLFIWLLRRQVSIATHKIKKTQQEFELAINAGKITPWTYDIASRTFSTLKGGASKDEQEYSIDEVRQHIHPDDCQRVLHAINKVASGRADETTEVFDARLNLEDEYQTYETTMVVSHKNNKNDNKIVGTLKDVSSDVSTQRILEDFQIKANFITSASGIVLFKYEIENELFSQINAAEDIIIQSFRSEKYLELVHEDDLDKAKEFIELMQQGTSKYISTEYRMLSTEKKYEWYAIEAMAYKYDASNKISDYLGLRRNNTKWKNIADDLIDLRTKAEVANKLKSAFIANMSHEIRTPLNAIVGFSNLMMDCDDATEKEYYKTIVKTNNDLLLQLINDVLDLSKIEAGFADFKYTHFEFSTFFTGLYDSLKLRVPNGIEFINKGQQADNLYVFADKNRITQVITNFATNAFKFTKQGSITLNYHYDENNLTISVTDTGIGISKDNQAKVFDRFEKLNEYAQGTGLGLPICRSLIEAMNGNIGLESEESVGSTFWISIPYKSNPNEEGDTETVSSRKLNLNHKPEPTIKYVSDGKKTLLIAEDMDNNYILAKRLLDDEYIIIRAKNGIEAVELTRQHKPDFILMDIKMPLMDGLTATEKIREFNTTVPIIALTAYVYDSNKASAEQSGCNAFLTKPYKKSILRETLKSVSMNDNLSLHSQKEY